MVGLELLEHLQRLDEQLLQLMKTFQEFKARTTEREKISYLQHLLYVGVIVLIIITITMTIGSFLPEVKGYLAGIAIVQALLAMGLYFYFIKKMASDSAKKLQQQTHFPSSVTMFELDQIRFALLQQLGKSPIPQSYLTPTAVKKMQQLVQNGVCTTIDECVNEVKKNLDKKHEEELKLIKKMQINSYH